MANEYPWAKLRDPDPEPVGSDIGTIPSWDDVVFRLTWRDPNAWLPTYAEVLVMSENTRGWPALDKGEGTHIAQHWQRLTDRFFARYCDRRINRETLTLWQVKLQERYDTVAPGYERAYKMMENNAGATLTDVWTGASTETEGSSIDTPDSVLNNDAQYADRRHRSKTSTKATGSLLDNIMQNIKTFKDLDTMFISEFESLFMGVLG